MGTVNFLNILQNQKSFLMFNRRKKNLLAVPNLYELLVPIGFHCIFFPYYESQWVPATVWLPKSFNISSL